MLKLLNNVGITITTKKPANQAAELNLKKDFAEHIQEKIFEIGNFKNRICVDFLNAEIKRLGKFDLSGIEEEILGVKNGKLGRLTAARKQSFENAIYEALKKVVNPIVDYIESFYDYADIVGSDSSKQQSLEWAMREVTDFKIDLVETDFQIEKLIFQKANPDKIESWKNHKETVLINLASALMHSDEVLNPARVGTQTIGEIIQTRILKEEYPQQLSYEIESETKKDVETIDAAQNSNEKTLSNFEANCNAIEYGIGHARSGRISKACSDAADRIIEWQSLPKTEQDQRRFQGQIDTCKNILENKFSSNAIKNLAAETLKNVQSAKYDDERDSLIDDMLDQYYKSILDNPTLIQSQSKNDTFKYSVTIDSKKITVPTDDIRRISIALNRFDDCGISSYMKKSYNKLLHYSIKHHVRLQRDARKTFIKIYVEIYSVSTTYETSNFQNAVNFANDFIHQSGLRKITLSCHGFGDFFIISPRNGITLDKSNELEYRLDSLFHSWQKHCQEIDEQDREFCIVDFGRNPLLECRLDSYDDLILAKSKFKNLFRNLLSKAGKLEQLEKAESIIDKTFTDFDFDDLENFLWKLNRGQILRPMNPRFYRNLKDVNQDTALIA